VSHSYWQRGSDRFGYAEDGNEAVTWTLLAVAILRINDTIEDAKLRRRRE
jgi:hypothetical protein